MPGSFLTRRKGPFVKHGGGREGTLAPRSTHRTIRGYSSRLAGRAATATRPARLFRRQHSPRSSAAASLGLALRIAAAVVLAGFGHGFGEKVFSVEFKFRVGGCHRFGSCAFGGIEINTIFLFFRQAGCLRAERHCQSPEPRRGSRSEARSRVVCGEH